MQSNLHVVLYTDGGSRPNKDKVFIGGVGIHGYVYEDTSETLNLKQGALNYTTEGYYNLLSQGVALVDDDDDDSLEEDDIVQTPNALVIRSIRQSTGDVQGRIIKPIKIIDYVETLIGLSINITNIIAEMTAVLFPLVHYRNKNVKSLTILTDSEFTINVLEKWCPIWKDNGWRRMDNKPVQNKELVELLYNSYLTACEVMQVRLIKVKGHDGDYGNESADFNATKAVNAGLVNECVSSFTDDFLTDPNVISVFKDICRFNSNEIKVNAEFDKELIEVEKHPYLYLKDVLFHKNDTNEGYYYNLTLPVVNTKSDKEEKEASKKLTKEEKENLTTEERLNSDKITRDFYDMIGKRDQSTIYQIVKSKTPIVIIDKIKTFVKKTDKTQYNKVYLIRLNNLYNKTNYTNLVRYGLSVFEVRGDKQVRTTIKDDQRKVVLTEVNPPRRVKDAVDELGNMRYLLDTFIKIQNGETIKFPDVYQVTELTDYIFVKTDNKTTIVPDYKHSVKFLKLPFKYYENGECKDAMYEFMVGYDIPPRSQYLHSCDSESKIHIITWPERGLGVRFAIFSQYKEAIAVWSNWYSNIIITKDFTKR